VFSHEEHEETKGTKKQAFLVCRCGRSRSRFR